MPAHFSISCTSKNPIVFAGLGCAKNAGSGPGQEFGSWRLSPSAPAMPGVGWSSLGRWSREWETLHSLSALWAAAEARRMSGFVGSKNSKQTFSFFPSSLVCFPLPFPIFLVCLRSPEWGLIQGLSYNCVQKTIWDQSEMLLQPVFPSDCSI